MRTDVKASSSLTVARGAAVLYVLAVIVLSLLPGGNLLAWVPQLRALDPILDIVSAHVVVATGLLLLAAHILAGILWWHPKVAPRLRLSPPLLLVLIAYLACLALMASADLRATLRNLAMGEIPAWLDLATGRLAPEHTLAYAGLGFLLALGWGRQIGLWRLGLLTFVLSGVLEAMQGLVPGRSPSRWDLLANGLGLVVGLTAGGLLIGRLWSSVVQRRPWSSGRRKETPAGAGRRVNRPRGHREPGWSDSKPVPTEPDEEQSRQATVAAWSRRCPELRASSRSRT